MTRLWPAGKLDQGCHSQYSTSGTTGVIRDGPADRQADRLDRKADRLLTFTRLGALLGTLSSCEGFWRKGGVLDNPATCRDISSLDQRETICSLVLPKLRQNLANSQEGESAE